MTPVAQPLRLATTDAGFDAALQARLHWSAETDSGIEQAVTDILAGVRSRGDAAVLEYTR
ncbi:MAG TPA: histidinol dehydrogenase, partial [Ramlibacter sp.]|nr:histidinol dehydrogenase [Ramlibacter sp.]